MVFETLLNPQEAESKPWEAFIYSLLITSVSLGMAYYIFPSQSSLIFLFLVSLASFPLIYRIIADEEEIDEKEEIRFSFLERHGRAIKVYGYLFLGVLAAVVFWNNFLPDHHTSTLFKHQIETIKEVENMATGAIINPSDFFLIFLNNVKVSTVTFLLSLFFGVGAIFVIAWNASVIGIFVTQAAKQSSSLLLGHINSLLGIALHGIPEIGGYLIAGTAGGILSVGLMRNRRNLVVIEDSLFMYAASILILLFAAGIETFITPFL